jgi:hypothetical protein
MGSTTEDQIVLRILGGESTEEWLVALAYVLVTEVNKVRVLHELDPLTRAQVVESWQQLKNKGTIDETWEAWHDRQFNKEFGAGFQRGV